MPIASISSPRIVDQPASDQRLFNCAKWRRIRGLLPPRTRPGCRPGDSSPAAPVRITRTRRRYWLRPRMGDFTAGDRPYSSTAMVFAQRSSSAVMTSTIRSNSAPEKPCHRRSGGFPRARRPVPARYACARWLAGAGNHPDRPWCYYNCRRPWQIHRPRGWPGRAPARQLPGMIGADDAGDDREGRDRAVDAAVDPVAQIIAARITGKTCLDLLSRMTMFQPVMRAGPVADDSTYPIQREHDYQIKCSARVGRLAPAHTGCGVQIRRGVSLIVTDAAHLVCHSGYEGNLVDRRL